MAARRLDEQRARELYDLHLNDRQIGAEIGVNVNTVMAWRHRERLPSWQSIDREAHRAEAQQADQVIQTKRRPRRRTYGPDIYEAVAEADARHMSYGAYMAARYQGTLPRRY